MEDKDFHRLITEIWQIWKSNTKRLDADQSDEAWENLINDVSEAEKQFNAHPEAVEMLVGLLRSVERRYKNV